VTRADADRRRMFTGAVVIDLAPHVGQWGRLSAEGAGEMRAALIAAQGLAVRLQVGGLARPADITGDPWTIAPAYRCASVEVTGTDARCVAAIVSWLRSHELEEDPS
jgi:hypothetical protein